VRFDGNVITIRDSRSRAELSAQLDFAWMIGAQEPASDRVLEAATRALVTLRTAVAQETGEPWPVDSGSGASGLPEAHAEIVGDTLRMWYGERSKPALELSRIHLPRIIGG
jgi:hypothetical protein